MKDLDRRTVMVAGTAAAAGLMASGAFAQESKKEGDQEYQAPGVGGGAKTATGPKRWHTATFPNINSLVAYVNTPPAQGAGEVVIVNVGAAGRIVALVYL